MNDELQMLMKRTFDAEHEVSRLKENLNELKQLLLSASKDSPTNCLENDENNFPQVAELILKNSKLKYQLEILQKAIEVERKKCSNQSKNMISSNSENLGTSLMNRLSALFIEAAQKAFPDVPDCPVPLSLTKDDKFGDYQCNAAMSISQILKGQGIKKSPREIAEMLIKNLPENDVINKTEIAGPGFVNIWLDRNFCLKLLTKVLKEGVKPPPLNKKLRVVVDFSSPNIAKEMHVGHLRSTIIGESISRLLEFLGHDVLRLNHVGDWGTQFGMLIAHLQDKYPDLNSSSVSPSVSDLQTFYKESKKRFDEDEEFKKRAYACVVKLQNLDPEYIKAWNLICDASRKEFQKVYDRLDINLKERGESFYQNHMKLLVEFLEKKGFLIEDEGRKVMFGLEEGQIPMTIVKSDGGFTYDTSDLAALKHRIEEEHADWVIYVVDNGQATHFNVLESCAKKVGILTNNKRFDFIGFGVVLGEDKKKFKTRSGDTVRLVELLDEGVKKARETLISKNRHEVLNEEELEAAQNSVAYGCIKYADLSHSRINDYVFSFDKMLEDKGNTAVYLLYAYTRICSIARNANVTPKQIKEAIDSNVSISLDHPKEWKLVKVLLKFEDVLLKVSQDLYLHQLCEFVYEITTTFSEFYDSCYCIEKDSKDGEIKKIYMGRLLLCEVTAMTIRKCFDILGLKPVSKM